MCHLCRKVDSIKGIDSKLMKPISKVLADVHKRIEPHMGDLLWEHKQRMTKIRKKIANLADSKLIPREAGNSLRELVAEIDESLNKISIHMIDHPVVKSTGIWSTLISMIMPSESASVRIEKQSEKEFLEKQKRKEEREKRRRKPKNENTSKKSPQTSKDSKETSQNSSQKSCPTSDIDPPERRIRQSIRIVNEWFERNERMIQAEADKDADERSPASVRGEGIQESPKTDVGIWKSLVRRGRSITKKGMSRSSDHRNYSTSKGDCVYDKPAHHLDLEPRVLNEVAEMEDRGAEGYGPEINPNKLIRHKKASRLSSKHKIPLQDGPRMFDGRKRQADQDLIMSGARSLGPSPRGSLEVLAAESSQGRTSMNFSISSTVSLTPSETWRALKEANGNLEGDGTPRSKLTLSSRPSAINAGSLMEQEQTENEFDDGLDGASNRADVGSPSPSPSPVHSPKPGATISRPCTPIPVGRAASPKPVLLLQSEILESPRIAAVRDWPKSSMDEDIPLTTMDLARQRRRAERRQRTEGHQMLDRSDEGRFGRPRFEEPEGKVSDAVLARRRRRGEGNSAPLANRYRSEERQRI